MTLDTNEGITAIRAELDKIEAAYALRGEIVASQEEYKMSLTPQEATSIIEARVNASKAKLKDLGFSGPVTRV